MNSRPQVCHTLNPRFPKQTPREASNKIIDELHAMVESGTPKAVVLALINELYETLNCI